MEENNKNVNSIHKNSSADNNEKSSLINNLDMDSLIKNLDTNSATNNPDLNSLIKNIDFGSLMKNIDMGSLIQMTGSLLGDKSFINSLQDQVNTGQSPIENTLQQLQKSREVNVNANTDFAKLSEKIDLLLQTMNEVKEAISKTLPEVKNDLAKTKVQVKYLYEKLDHRRSKKRK